MTTDPIDALLAAADKWRGSLSRESFRHMETLIRRLAAALRETREYYESMLVWQVTCKGCADSLDKSYEAYQSEECERLRAALRESQQDGDER